MRPQSILNRYLMAFAILDCGKWRKVRDLDPRTLLTLLDFKSSAINQALPTFHINNPIPVYFGEKPSMGKQFELSLFLILIDPTTFIPHIGQRRGNLILLASPVTHIIMGVLSCI